MNCNRVSHAASELTNEKVLIMNGDGNKKSFDNVMNYDQSSCLRIIFISIIIDSESLFW